MNKAGYNNDYLKRHFIYLGLVPFVFLIKGLLTYPFHSSLTDFIFCLTILGLGSYFLFLGSNYLFKDKYKAAYFSLLILVLCFASIDIYYVLLAPFLRVRYYLLGIVLLVILWFWFLKRSPISREINKILNVFTIAFFIIFLIDSHSDINTYLSKPISEPVNISNIRSDNKSLPDIYVLLMDGYANANNLKKYWNFSNAPFLDSLRKQGFHVVDSSKSNYYATVQTVSSMLNMEYCKRQYTGSETPFLFDIASNKTINILSQNKYTIHNYSIFDFDNYSSPNRLRVFSEKSSLFYHCLTKSIYFFYKDALDTKEEFLKPDLKDRRLYEQLIQVSKLKTGKPKFVYGHFFISHPPFYLDSIGKVSNEIQERSKYTVAEGDRFGNKDTTDNTFGSPEKDDFIMQAYLNHVKASNKYVYPVVKSILANARRPPIILVMSDHGFRYTTGITNRELESERYGNLCAFYFPDKDYSKLSNSITPVNYIRLILSKALSIPYQPLPNKFNL